MNDLRIEDNEQQQPYAGLVAESPAPQLSDAARLARLESMLLWVSKQPWPQDPDQTWEGLVAAYDKALNPDPLPELPSRGYRVGR